MTSWYYVLFVVSLITFWRKSVFIRTSIGVLNFDFGPFGVGESRCANRTQKVFAVLFLFCLPLYVYLRIFYLIDKCIMYTICTFNENIFFLLTVVVKFAVYAFYVGTFVRLICMSFWIIYTYIMSQLCCISVWLLDLN